MEGLDVTKPLLIGQAPARSGDGRAFTGASGKRLCDLLELPDYDALVHLLDLTNLIPEVQPKVPGKKGDSFSMVQARRAAMRILTKEISGPPRTLILCGARVAEAFEVPGQPFRIYRYGNLRLATFPHPSGINLFWNNQENRTRASSFLKALVFDWPMNHPALRHTIDYGLS